MPRSSARASGEEDGCASRRRTRSLSRKEGLAACASARLRAGRESRKRVAPIEGEAAAREKEPKKQCMTSPKPRRRWASRSPPPGLIRTAPTVPVSEAAEAAGAQAAAGAASARPPSPRGGLATAPWRQGSRSGRRPSGGCPDAAAGAVEARPGEWVAIKNALYAYRTHRIKYTSDGKYREYCAVRGWTLHCKERVVPTYTAGEVPPYTVPKKWLAMQVRLTPCRSQL